MAATNHVARVQDQDWYHTIELGDELLTDGG